MIRSFINSTTKKLRKLRSELRIRLCTRVVVSLGENCLTDAVLERHGVKSFTTPYSHARSNADYALLLEKREYSNFLEPDLLVYDELDGSTVVRNRINLECDPIYLKSHCHGFEFSHHDVKGDSKYRSSYIRKVERLKRFKGKRDFVFFYHYRMSPNHYCHECCLKTISGISHELNIDTCKYV